LWGFGGKRKREIMKTKQTKQERLQELIDYELACIKKLNVEKLRVDDEIDTHLDYLDKWQTELKQLTNDKTN
jgi:hypothetical protein